MPDLEPTRSTSGKESGPRPCVFEPPAWNWSKSERHRLVGPGRLGLGPPPRRPAPARRVEAVGPADHRQARPAPGGLPGRPGRGVGLRQALPGPQLPGQGPPVVPERQGAERGAEGRQARGDRRADDHAGRPGRAPGPASSSSRTTWSPRRSPTPCPLDEFVERRLPLIEPVRQGRLRRDLARVLADLTARLHDAGFVHQDFHPGNLLIRIEPDDTLRLAVIDLDALRVTRRLSWGEVRENLALLNHYFWSRCNRADRYRFLTRLPQGPPRAPDARPPAARPRDRAGHPGLGRAALEAVGPPVLGPEQVLQGPPSGPGLRAVASRDLDPSSLEAILADPDGPIAREGPIDPEGLADRPGRRGDRCWSRGGRPRSSTSGSTPRSRWSRSSTWSARRGPAGPGRPAQHLKSRGLPTPQNLAYVVRTGRGPIGRWLTREAYLVTIKAEPSITLGDYARDRPARLLARGVGARQIRPADPGPGPAPPGRSTSGRSPTATSRRPTS